MTTYIYTIRDRDPYLTSVKDEGYDMLTIRISDVKEAVMCIGNARIDMVDGVGRVKLSTLGEGVFTPEIIFKDKTVRLYPIHQKMGKVSLACPEEIYAALGARVLNAEVRVCEMEKELQTLKDAVWGKAIF